MDINNPHDRFAKEVLSVHANAKDFLKVLLPKEIAAQLDFSTLIRDKEKYSDEALREYFSDMVFTCRSGTGSVKISLLFEHKSFPPSFPQIQLLSYMLGIWKTCEKKKEKPTAVIPVILYHGKKHWKQEELSEKLNAELFKPFVPDFKYILMDLSCYTNQYIRGSVFSRAAVKI